MVHEALVEVDSLRQRFKKVDENCWLVRENGYSCRNELYYQPFDGCAVFVQPNRFPDENLAEITISLRTPWNEEDHVTSLIWWKYTHTREVWKSAKSAVDMLNTYHYPCGEWDVDLENLDIALKMIGFTD